MFQVDEQFLNEVGLADLPAAEKPMMLGYIQETLEMRIGAILTEGLPENVLLEFNGYIEKDQSDKALQWLRQHAPNYREVAQAEIAKLKQEIKADSAQIIKDSEGR